MLKQLMTLFTILLCSALFSQPTIADHVKDTENKDKADKFFSVLVLIGVVNIPVIKKSVDWWSTLHQSASITLTSKPAIDPVMLYPLMFSIVAFIGLIFGLVILSSQKEILKREKYKSWVKNI